MRALLARAGLAATTGFREIRANKARSILSFSAVSVGVASLLYTFAQVRGMHEETEKALRLMGPGRLSVKAKQGYVSKGLSPGLTTDDAEEIRALPGLHMAYPKAGRWGGEAFYQGRRYENLRFVGTTPDWAKRDWVYTLRGRFFSDRDVKTVARVCVVVEPGGWVEKPFWARFWGEDGAFELMVQRTDLLGRELRLGEHLFTVVGVLREPPRDKDPRWTGHEWGGDGLVLAPITGFHQYLLAPWDQNRPKGVDQIEVDTGDEATVPSVRKRIEQLLTRKHRGEVDFEVSDSREEIANRLSETRGYIIIGMALGSVAILAGGIGIMNVTLATIFLRVKEIGIRRALGASRLDIVAQFVAEAMLLGLCGGAAGVGLGYAGIELIARQAGRDIAQLTLWHMVASLAIAALTGFVFSVAPAWRASGLDPVEALRNE